MPAAIARHGARFYSETVHAGDEEKDGRVEITTENGPVIRAGAAVFATNSPTNNKVEIHSKQIPDRTYAIAGRVPKGSVPDALIWDTYDAYHYVRIQEWNDDEDLLIVGGEDHRSGEANDMDRRFARLTDWTRKRYPGFGKADYRWSGQVLEPADFMPFSGRNPGNENIYVHTGDSGQGITNGVAGSLTIVPLIIGEHSRHASLFDPGRKPTGSMEAIGEFVRGPGRRRQKSGRASRARRAGFGRRPEARRGRHYPPRSSQGRRLSRPDGKLIERSASCTHLGCLVHWNGFERCWDCPCHGSQFAPDGSVLNGPAVQPLAAAEG